MSQIYGAGGKTPPKRGRLGTGSYWPQGTPIFRAPGYVFPELSVPTPMRPALSFGQASRAGIGTVAGRDLTKTNGATPLDSNGDLFGNISTKTLLPARVVSSPRDALKPMAPVAKPLQMPHERNSNSPHNSKQKAHTYKTAFGASRTMPVDTAFKRNVAATRRTIPRTPPGNAVEAVKKSAIGGRTFSRMAKPVNPNTPDLAIAQSRTPPASFVSKGNIWYDPNNSFIVNRPNAASGDNGSGRWGTIKRGVVGGLGGQDTRLGHRWA